MSHIGFRGVGGSARGLLGRAPRRAGQTVGRSCGNQSSHAPANRASIVERLEPRRLLCGLPHLEPHGPVIETAPETVDPRTGISPPTGREVADPANIVWVNRGLASDGFAARFGTSANVARAVVDAVIVAYERMIGSFDYPLAGQQYDLTLSMGASGGGFGASASLATSQGGKPKSGSITMGAGNGSADANDTNGWFMDPTPFESSEFLGTIQHAYTGDAQAGSPAAGLGDFYTVVAAEMTHCMGLFGSALAGWTARTTNTGQASTTASPGFYWVFDGPSVKHLLTSNNAFAQDFGSAVHSSEGPGSNINFNGLNWIGTDDQGNPGYEFGRRYLVNHPFGLMFKDAYGYLSNDPAQFNTGTFYCMLNQTTGQVLVRGGAGTSADSVSVSLSGSTITISVNVGNDIAGSGSLPGAGNLPAFTTNYSTAEVSSILIQTGDGADSININSIDSGTTITVQCGAGDDDIDIAFPSGNLDNVAGALSISGEAGTENVTLWDDLATFGDIYTIDSNTVDRVIFGGLTYATVEGVTVHGQSGANTFNVSDSSTPLILNGANGNDVFNMGLVGANAEGVNGPVTVNGGADVDTLNYNDPTNGFTDTYTVTSTTVTRTANGTVTYGTIESLVVHCGTAGNTVNVTSTVAVTPIVVNGNGGDDAIIISTTGDWDLNILGNVTFDGGADSDTVRINDTADAGADTYSLSVSQTTKNSVASIVSFSTTEAYTLDANNDANTITMISSINGPVHVNSRGGVDLVDIIGNFLNTLVFVDTGVGLDTVRVNSDNSGIAGVQFDNSQDLALLHLFTGATARMNTGGNKLLFTQALTLAGTGTLNLTDNDMILDYAGASQLAATQARINAARNNGAWNGSGITSSSAGSNPNDNTTLGAMEATAYDSIYGAGALFNGVDPDGTAVLVKYTYYGDADFSGQVDFDDYVRTDAGFNNNWSGWPNGDTDGSGGVDFDDYVLIDLGFNTQTVVL